jgi:SAM-dependent methyltransferase
MFISSYNIEAIKRFGESNLEMDIDSPHNYVDARMGRLFTYMDLQYIKQWVIPQLNQNQRKNLSVLDVGAGKGRITRHLLTIANRVVAIEPFEGFFQILSNLSAPHTINFETHNCTLLDYFKISDCQFDFIFVAGVTPYISDIEIDEFYNNLRLLVKEDGLILVRDYGIENRHSGKGPYGSIEVGIEIFRPVIGKMRIFRQNHLQCIKSRRAYPSIITWNIYRKWPNGLTAALWRFTSWSIFYPIYYQLSKLNIPHRTGGYYMYLLKPS